MPNTAYVTSRVMRPVLLDVEDLKDASASVVRAIKHLQNRDPNDLREPTVAFEVQRWEGPHSKTPEELPKLSVPDRNNLRLIVTDPDGLMVTFDVRRSLWDTSTMEAWGQQAIESGAKTLLKAGVARAEWVRLAAALPWLYVVLVTLAWLWASLTTPLAPAAHVLFLLSLGGLILGARRVSGDLARRRLDRTSPTVFRAESRAATHARRADGRANIRVAVYSVVGTVLSLFIIGVIWWLLTGNVTGAPTPPSPTP
jgi:hypothetical protein